MLLFVATLSLTFTACSDDDDEPSNDNLAGTSWKIISDKTADGEDNETAGIVVTFLKDGNVKFSPSQDWTYAKWSTNNGELKIVLGEGEPDDFMLGKFVINGKNATYTYHWEDVNGDWANVNDLNIMILEKQ